MTRKVIIHDKYHELLSLLPRGNLTQIKEKWLLK
jgi:hypothetical protein